MLEEMAAFFEKRLDGYDAHMLENIHGAREFYPFTASCLPKMPDAHILDLGCGTGLELDWFFRENPTATVTGIDLSEGMLDALKRKFPNHSIRLLCGSYFELPLGEQVYDAAVSVESLHHFTREEKTALYAKLHSALKDRGYLILTDYFAASEEEERVLRLELLDLKAQQGLSEKTVCHFDTPLTVEHELEALRDAGFQNAEVLRSWGATGTIKAVK